MTGETKDLLSRIDEILSKHDQMHIDGVALYHDVMALLPDGEWYEIRKARNAAVDSAREGSQ